MEERSKNVRTCIAGMVPDRPAAELIREAFEACYPAAARGGGGRGFVVGALTSGSARPVVRHFPLAADGQVTPVVVGRHECADLVIGEDPAISLRHVLLLLRIDREGHPLVRVLDLRSGTGMTDAAGRPHYSLAADGPVAIRVAGSGLFVLPADGALDPAADPAAEYARIQWPAPVPWIPDRAPEEQLAALSESPGSTSVVSVVIGGTGAGRPIVRRRGGKRAGMVKLEFGDRSHEHAVDLRALRAGTLIGRYDRCDVSYLTAAMPDVVSRVHALLISVDERVHVFDVGSTNGLTYQGFVVRGMALPDHQPSTLELADDVRLTWWPA